MGTTTTIGNGVSLSSNVVNWAAYWANHLSLEYSSRSGLSLLETKSGSSFNASIMPSVAKISSTDYLTQSYTNFEIGDASGYIEVSWYHNGQTGIKTLFATGSNAATQRYFRVYTSNNVLYLTVRSNISTVFNNLIYVTAAITTGWHVIRFTSTGSAYTAVLDGGSTLTVGNGLTLSTGSNDGRWLNMVPTRNTLEIGCYTDSGGNSKTTTDFYIRYIDYNNKHYWVTHGQGNKVFDLIGTIHWTWTGTNHTYFNSNASTLLLDSGYSLWKAYNQPDEYVPYKGGSPFDVSSFLTGYTKVSDNPGSSSTFNLAPALVGFNETQSASPLLALFDRSNTTRQSATSRSSKYYDATNLATKCRYHSSEIANPTVFHEFFNNGYRGLFYPKVTTAIASDLNYYPISIAEIFVINQDTKGSLQYSLMQNCCNTHVFAAQNGAKDSDGYILTKLTDIKHFGAKTTNTPEQNFTYIQRAVNYAFNNVLTFGTAGEEYVVSQPVYLKSYKTYTINSTIKIKGATTTLLTQNYTAGEDHIHVVSTDGFNIGEWIGITDNAQTYDYNLWYGWNTWIVNIDRNNKIIYFNSAEGASCIFNYTVAHNAWCGHAQSVFIAENKTDITLNGTGLIDCNQQNQAPINGLLPSSVFEELRSTSGLAVWKSDNITIQNLKFRNGLRHNICISGTGTSAADRCDHIVISGVESTFAHNKNCNIRYCDDVSVTNYVGNDALYEDGLMFYLGNTNCYINNIECKRNGRWGVCWNSAVGSGLTGGNITTEGNVYGGFQSTSASATLTGLTMKDRLLISNQYDNANNITLTNVAISNYTPSLELYNGCIVGFLGEVTNVAINNLTITDCNGLGIYSTNQFTPANPPVNVDIDGGGFYNHTGTKASLYSGSDIVFTNFENYP